MGIRLGPAGRQRVHRRHPSRPRTRRQLDRHRRHLRPRPLRRSGGAGARESSGPQAPTSSPSAPCAGTPTAPSTARSRPRLAREELEASLRRLGVDAIDLYQIHWPNPEEEIEEGWETLARFKEEGKVRWIGVSNFNVEQMKRAQKIAPITSLQPPYSMLRRAIEEEILPFAQANGIGVINYSPMVSGLLTGKMTAERVAAFPPDDWRRRARRVQRAAPEPEPAAGGTAARDRQRHGVSPAWWPLPGRCIIRPSPRPSWAAAAPSRLMAVAPALYFPPQRTRSTRALAIFLADVSRPEGIGHCLDSGARSKNPGQEAGALWEAAGCTNSFTSPPQSRAERRRHGSAEARSSAPPCPCTLKRRGRHSR